MYGLCALRAQLFEARGDVILHHAVNLNEFSLFLLNSLNCLAFLRLEHARPRRLLYHPKDLDGPHVEHLGDAALHYEEVRVVHVELNGVEQVLHALQLRAVPIDHILVAPSDCDLRSWSDG